MNRSARLVPALVSVLAVLAACQPAANPGSISSGSPATSAPTVPSASAAATPGPTPGPTTERAALFLPTFAYQLPAGTTFDVREVNATWFEMRVPAYAEAGHPAGIIVQAIGGGRKDVCDPGSAAVEISGFAVDMPVIEYLQAIDVLTVTDARMLKVDGQDSSQATVVAGPETADCPDLWLWVEDTESFGSIPRGMTLRIIDTSVMGEHVVFTIYGEAENPGWGEIADQFLESVNFLGA